MANKEAARDYYNNLNEREWARLESPEGRVEYLITTSILESALPQSGRVLDLGGGPGRYSQWLSGLGFKVTLADLSPTLLEVARTKLDRDAVEEIVETDARDLSHWPKDHFDALLALGPLYHLTAEQDRRQALSEIIRVTAPGGVIAAALMPNYGYLRRTLSIPDERHRMADPEFVQQVLRDGIFRNDIPGRFTEGYGVDSANPGQMFEEAGLETILVASTHGFAAGIEEELDQLRSENEEAYRSTLDLLVETSTDPTLFGLTSHLLWVGRKPGQWRSIKEEYLGASDQRPSFRARVSTPRWCKVFKTVVFDTPVS